MTDRARILVVGDVIDDLIVTPDSAIRADTDTSATIERRAGGSAANVATWLGHLGAEVDFIGTVGAEDHARHSELLAEYGVTALLVGDSEAVTGTIVIVVDGESRTMLTARGANLLTGPDVVPALDAYAHLHLTGYSLFTGTDDAGWRTVIDRAHSAGATVSVDTSSAGYLADFGIERFLDIIRDVDVLLPNTDEALLVTGATTRDEALQVLRGRFPLVVVTGGADGVWVATAEAVDAIPAQAATLVDATGAGDAFAAAFLSRWVPHRDAVEAARFATRIAATAVSAAGARPSSW
jgi:sugar/nucleoside kinase (ribokinase family)